MSFLPALLVAGAQLMQGLNEQEAADDARKDKKETTLLELQDNERTRQAAMDRLKLELSQKIAAEKAMNKQNLLGKAILDQGKDSSAAMLEAFKAKAEKKERFNESADNLARVLAS